MAANRRFETLGDVVRAKANLLAQCPTCTNRAIVPADALSRYCLIRRWDAGLAQIGARLRCSRCGHKGARVGIRFGTPDAAWRPPVDENDWKRLVRKLRG